MGTVRVLVHTFPCSYELGVENQTVYDWWTNTAEGEWVKNFSIGELEITEHKTTYSFDIGGHYPIQTNYAVYATFSNHDYLIYKLKWAK